MQRKQSRLCRPLCGDGFASPESILLKVQRGCASQRGGRAAKFSESLQAAEPQNAELLNKYLLTNGFFDLRRDLGKELEKFFALVVVERMENS
jgi:hypothetical protein